MLYELYLYNQKENKHLLYKYDTENNVIYDENNKPIIVDLPDIPGNKKKINIQLGFSCNMSCSYCLQSKTSKKKFNKENCDKIITKIKGYNLENTKIEFWGGEPLLYLEEIVYFIRKLKHDHYVIITNGMNLTLRLVKFFIKHNVNVILSHDAQSQDVRGKNPFEKKESLEAIKYLYRNNKEKFSINSVITNNNINTMDRLEYFGNYLEEDNFLEIPHSGEGPVYNSSLDLLSKDNLSNKIFEDILGFYGMKYGFYNQAIYSFLKSLNKTKIENITTKCGINNSDKYKILSLDGKELSCHNYDFKFNINTLQDSNKCKTCLVAHLCKSSCPAIDKKSELFHKNCEIMFETYSALLRASIFILTNNNYELIDYKKI